MDFAAKLLNGSANGLETILGILHEASPSVFGVADLMAEVRHEAAPCKRGAYQYMKGNMRSGRGRVKRKGAGEREATGYFGEGEDFSQLTV
jgi:hypothetical protein